MNTEVFLRKKSDNLDSQLIYKRYSFLLITHYSLLITHYSLLIIHYLLLVTCYLFSKP
ncbi:MAG: hypothetical protein F6K47_25665 [Symploca sp. SIO2E6]|nr:hypothetical protein [Symploca sp. SIO2E6]